MSKKSSVLEGPAGSSILAKLYERFQGWLFLILALVVISVVLNVVIAIYNGIDGHGLISHDAETLITAKGNWIVGESKYCISNPLGAPSGNKDRGYAFSFLNCDDGPPHQIKVTFWGRKNQPEYTFVSWKCIRHESDFVCYEQSGEPAQN